MESFSEATLKPLLGAYQKDTGSLVTLLQDVQAALGYLPREALQHISKALDIPVSRLFCIATFYNAFSLEPRGRHTVSVCLGTACHVKGGENLADMLSRQLDLSAGEGTAADKSVTLKKVRCLGCCSLAPVVKFNENIHGYMTQTRTAGLLSKYRKDAR